MENNKENDNDILLDVRHLKTQFRTNEGIAHAVEDASFYVKKGETLGIVGESGSGKSVTALSIMRLVTGEITGGEVIFEGKDLLKLTEHQMEKIRGNSITMIFQDPMTSLDPVYTIGFQLKEAIFCHLKMTKKDAFELAVQMLGKVGIPNPRQRMNDYPHQLSGGMRQRVMIAMGLYCNPKLLIADEPTTALDVTIQAQILDIMRSLKQQSNMSLILITHDLGVVAGICDRVAVMYCGQVVESGSVHEIFKNPRHKYTIGLLNSIPRMDQEIDKLNIIDGSVPSIVMLPSGCRFHPRCPYACEICKINSPEMKKIVPGHFAACHFALKKEEAQNE